LLEGRPQHLPEERKPQSISITGLRSARVQSTRFAFDSKVETVAPVVGLSYSNCCTATIFVAPEFHAAAAPSVLRWIAALLHPLRKAVHAKHSQIPVRRL
jgi:hypothetical protein